MATIGDVEGIDPKSATRLRKAGVRTTEGLIKVAATSKGRKALAEKTGIPAATLLGWVNRADLMRIKGVGAEYADLLETAGCDTVKELRRRNPVNLTAAMVEVNEQKRLVRRLPTEVMVIAWIEQAMTMDSAVKH
jgi:predicted flap endonuclease-1-like 5' DNA nuclease